MDYDAGLSLCVCLYNETDVNLPSFPFCWQIPTLFVRVRMGASWSVMSVTSFKGQGRERWPLDFGIDRKKMRVKLFLYPWEYKNNVSLSGKCLNAFNEFIQDKIRAGGVGAHMQSHVLIDIYREGGGCVCCDESTSRGKKKRPETRTSLKKVSSVCDPCNSSASTSRESPYYSGLLSFTSRKREEKQK